MSLFRYVDEQAFQFNNRKGMDDAGLFSEVVKLLATVNLHGTHWQSGCGHDASNQVELFAKDAEIGYNEANLRLCWYQPGVLMLFSVVGMARGGGTVTAPS